MKNMKAFQAYPVLVEENTLTLAAARAKRTINLKEKLPAMIRDRVAHLVGFITTLDLDPTFTTAPTVVGMSNALRSVVLRADGGRIMLDVSGPDLRAMEFYENGGKHVAPAPDLNSATTNNFYDQRTIDMGPGGFRGNPTDFCLPCVLQETGVIELEAPALTDISADTIAPTTVVQRTWAIIVGLTEVRIPPKVELRNFATGGSTLELGERALYTSLLLLNDADHGAIAAGDFATFTLQDRRGSVFQGVPASVLQAMYQGQQAVGQFGIIQGEPRSATDDNLKIVNGATPTALVSPTAAYQPIIWSPEGSGINGIEVEGPIKLTWSGTQATAVALLRRILPRGEQEASDLAILAFNKLGLKFTGGKVKTLSKVPFKNPARIEYMPWSFGYAK